MASRRRRLKHRTKRPTRIHKRGRRDRTRKRRTGGTSTDEIRVYATNYNVLRTLSDKGGLPYSR